MAEHAVVVDCAARRVGLGGESVRSRAVWVLAAVRIVPGWRASVGRIGASVRRATYRGGRGFLDASGVARWLRCACEDVERAWLRGVRAAGRWHGVARRRRSAAPRRSLSKCSSREQTLARPGQNQRRVAARSRRYRNEQHGRPSNPQRGDEARFPLKKLESSHGKCRGPWGKATKSLTNSSDARICFARRGTKSAYARSTPTTG